MYISTKGRYALRVMVDLAEQPEDVYVPLKEIADREEISKEYLNTILKVLVENGLLLSLRGKGGGYKLTHAPEQYTVGNILRLTEGSLAPVPCVSGGACPNAGHCPSLTMWKKLDDMINSFFDNITLVDLMEDKEDRVKNCLGKKP